MDLEIGLPIITIIVNLCIVIFQLFYSGREIQKVEILKSNLNIEKQLKIEYHKKLYDLYSELWSVIQTLQNYFHFYGRRLQSSPDLNKMDELEFNDFLDNSELKNYDKESIIRSNDRNSVYSEKIFWYSFNKMSKSYNDLFIFFSLNKIYFNEEIKELIDSLIDLYNSSLNDLASGGETRDPIWREEKLGYRLIRSTYDKVNKDGPLIISQIEKLIENDLTKFLNY